MVHNRQLAAWICAACSLSFAHAAGSLSWYAGAAIAAVEGLILLYIMYRLPEGGLAAVCRGSKTGRVFLLLCSAWTALMAGFAAALTAEAFPMVEGYPMIPLTVLALSAWAAHHSDAVGARMASMLLPLLGVFYLLIVIFGLKEVKATTWKQNDFDLRAVCVMLLPLGAVLLKRGQGRIRAYAWIIGAAAAASALALVALPWGSLYRAVMSISVLGIMERFEALLCAAMAMGGVCLCTLLGRAGLGAAQACTEKKETTEILYWILAIIGLALTDRQKTGPLLTGCLVFWVILPLLTLWIEKSKKDEKRC